MVILPLVLFVNIVVDCHRVIGGVFGEGVLGLLWYVGLVLVL